METPPNTNAARSNAMHYKRADVQEDILGKNDLMNKFGQKYSSFKKDAVQVERENYNKWMTDLKKHATYLESTKWMFENNSEILPSDNFTINNL